MKGRSKDSTRTLTERILAGHEVEGAFKLRGSAASAEGRAFRVDQVILARTPSGAIGSVAKGAPRKSAVELAVAYPPECISWGQAGKGSKGDSRAEDRAPPSGLLMAQPGAGFAPLVHLERFAAPGRLAVADDSRLALLGAIGMLTVSAAGARIESALELGTIDLPEPVSILIALSGRLRPFVNVRDAAFQLLKNGAREVVSEVARRSGAPVILEFGGPATKQLSVPDRASLASLAPRLGAHGALFPADDKTETFLRDQRRSKAFRAVAAEGAAYEVTIPLDLATVDPLLLESNAEVLPVRLLEGKPVGQVILGGDSGATLRDLYTVGSLLKGKRPPGNVEFLFAPPSRQCLEVLARDGVLLDLIAMGARVIEPDRRVLTGDCYPPSGRDLSLSTFDPPEDDGAGGGAPSQRVTASAETLAFALAHGHLGDPRGFRRQVRVALPRQLPTEDTLLLGGTRKDGSPRRSRPPSADA